MKAEQHASRDDAPRPHAILCEAGPSLMSLGCCEHPCAECYEGVSVARRDYIHNPASSAYLVVADSGERLGWRSGVCRLRSHDGTEEEFHIVVLVTEASSDAYLSYLLERGVSLVFCGRETPELPEAAKKLERYFGIRDIELLPECEPLGAH